MNKSKKKDNNVIDKYKDEIKNKYQNNIEYFEESVNNKKVYSFLNKFIICEYFIKNMIYHYNHNNGKEYRQIKDIKLDVKKIKLAVKAFNYDIDEDILNKIFGSVNKRGNKSCKKLRDAFVHGFDANDGYEIVTRYEEINEYMESFLKIINLR